MAQEAKYTPGPWDYFVGNANGRGLVRIETAHNAPVAGVHVASMTRGAESEANARLIAASPEAIQSVKDLLSLIEELDGGEHDDAPELIAARAVIAKAEGR